MDKYEIVKFKDNEFEMDVNVSPNEETVWLTQIEIAELFEKDRKTITRHIQNILKEYELMEKQVCSKKEHTASDGKLYSVNIYNLDMIIAIGYRVKSKRAIFFRQWATKVLKQYLLNGYVINENRVVVSNENYIELRNEVASINNRLIKVEDKVFDNYDKNSILFNGQFYDAYTLVQSIFEKAIKEIIIIDNYVDRTILDRLVNKKKNVNVTIYTHKDKSKLLNKDVEMFNKQYGNLVIKYTDKVHDRYIIIDQEKLFHLGASIKDLGKKIFSINELDNNNIDYLLMKV